MKRIKAFLKEVKPKRNTFRSGYFSAQELLDSGLDPIELSKQQCLSIRKEKDFSLGWQQACNERTTRRFGE